MRTISIDIQDEAQARKLQLEAYAEISKAIVGRYSKAAILTTLGNYFQRLGIADLAFFTMEPSSTQWKCNEFRGRGELFKERDISAWLEPIFQLQEIGDEEPPEFLGFKYIFPVLYREKPIAFLLLSESSAESVQHIDEYIQFIYSISSLVALSLHQDNKPDFIDLDIVIQDLETARDIQERLVPRDFDYDSNFDAHAVYLPHKAIGGDYYDVIWTNENTVVFSIGDIAGKGISASLLMACCQANMRTLVARDFPLDQIVDMLNFRVREVTKGERYVTTFIGKFNYETRTLNYVNCGHTPSVLVDPNTMEATELRDGCYFLGFFEDVGDIKVGEVKLPPGALVVNYTDGITELMNNEEEMLDIGGLIDFALNNCELDMKSFNEALMDHVVDYKGYREFDDDVSVLSCRFN